MTLRLTDDQASFDALFQLYQRDALDAGTVLDILDIERDREGPKCARCDGTGSIGVTSTYRCPEC